MLAVIGQLDVVSIITRTKLSLSGSMKKKIGHKDVIQLTKRVQRRTAILL
jgi:hypothetical protein